MILKLQITTNSKGKVFELPLKKSVYRVGRRFDNDLRIKETYVSAYHAEIHKDKDENYTVIDKGSSNGTFVNGKRVTGDNSVSLREGDYVKFGLIKIKVSRYVDKGPQVVALDERESATKAISPTQPLKSTKPIKAPKPGAIAVDGKKTLQVSTAPKIPPKAAKVPPAVATNTNDSKSADLTKKLTAVESERDGFKKEIETLTKKNAEQEANLKNELKSLEEKIQTNKDQAKNDQSERKASSENDAKEITRITKEFAKSEADSKSEILKLKNDLDLAKIDASKAKPLQAKLSDLEKEIMAERNEVTQIQKQQKDSADSGAKELERLASEFSNSEASFKTEISQLNKDLVLANRNAEKAIPLQSKLDSLEKEILAERNEVTQIQKQQKESSELGEKEIARITEKFADSKGDLDSEITQLKKDLNLANKEATDLQKQQQKSSNDGEKEISRLTGKLADSEDKLKSEITQLNQDLKLANKEAEKAIPLQGKLETLEKEIETERQEAIQRLKLQQESSADGKKEVSRLIEKFASSEGALKSRITQLNQDLDQATENAEKVNPLQEKLESLEEEIKAEREEASQLLKLQEEFSEGSEKEISLLNEKFAGSEDKFKSEISQLKQDLDLANKDAKKALPLQEKLESLEKEIKTERQEATQLLKLQEESSADGEEEIARITKKFTSSESDLQSKISKLELEVEATEPLQEKLEVLEREIETARSEASQIQKQRQASSENDAKEITRITHEFATCESEFKTEIAQLKNDLGDANKAASKAKIAEESKSKGDEVIADLHTQISDLKESRETAKKDSEEIKRASHSLTQKFEKEKEEKEKLHIAFKSKTAEVATVAALAAKFEKSEHIAAEAGKKKAEELGEQIASLQLQLEEESTARKSSEAVNLNQIQELETSGNEKNEIEKGLIGKVSQLELMLKDAQAKSANELADLTTRLAEADQTKAETQKEVEQAITATQVEKQSSASLAMQQEEQKANLEQNISQLESGHIDLQEKITHLENELLETTVSRDTAVEVNQKIPVLELEASNLQSALLDQKDSNLQLDKTLKNTQEGLSQVLRNAWSEKEEQRIYFQNDENIKLGEAEEALSQAIHRREDLAKEIEKLEKNLLSKDKTNEKLQDEIDALESRLSDNHHARRGLNEEIETIESKLSNSLESHTEQISELKTQLLAEQEERSSAEKALEDSRDQVDQGIQAEKDTRDELAKEIKEWEKRYEQLKTKKITLGKETETLEEIKEAIVLADTTQADQESAMAELNLSISKLHKENTVVGKENTELVSQKKELDAGLQVARTELFNVQKRGKETRLQEEKLTLRIGAAEKRVKALKHLEIELEQAIDRKRESKGLNRKEVFSTPTNEAAITATLNGSTSEESFCRQLVSKLDLLDDLTMRYDNKWRYPKVSEQLVILKGSFLDLLREHSVDQFLIEPGTVLSLEERKRIKLIHSKETSDKKPALNGNGSRDGQSVVVDTLRPGYIYKKGQNSIILRKAEVIVS